MTIDRPPFTAPLLVLDDFLPAGEAAACLQECIDLRPVYMPASVGQGQDNRIDRKIRRNDVVYLDSVFSPAPDRSKILTLVKRRVRDQDCNRLWHEGYTLFDVINYATAFESVLSRYGRCDFYGLHQDTKQSRTAAPAEIHHRLVTLVYYMNTEPERFTGGELTLQQDDGTVTVTPRHNRAVVFPSFVWHRVGNVQLDDDDHAAGRFSLNMWMGFR